MNSKLIRKEKKTTQKVNVVASVKWQLSEKERAIH